MKFHQLLNQYCNDFECTNLELSQLSGISKSLVSRYKKGERTPAIDGDSLKKLSVGLKKAAEIKGINYDMSDIYSVLRDSIAAEQKVRLESSRIFSYNLNYFMELLSVTNAELARFIHMDGSLVSRIRREHRNITDIDGFARKCSKYIFANKIKGNGEILTTLLCCEPSVLEDENAFVNTCVAWMLGNNAEVESDISGFLSRLDTFDLNEYIKAIKFDDIKIPTVPMSIPTSKKYFGIRGMREGTLDFLKFTVLNPVDEPVFIYNDLPMTELSEDMEFSKKWMFGLAAVLKRGLHIDTVHCLDRPFSELMLGLESWIPLYMTGQISPYYLSERHNSVFCKAYYSSGGACLTGECISGNIADGMYYVSKKSADIDYCRKRRDNLLKFAHPLMRIFRRENEKEFLSFIKQLELSGLDRKGILYSPPVYTMSDKLLISVLQRNGIDDETSSIILRRVEDSRKVIFDGPENRCVSDIVSIVSEEAFAQSPVKLHLANLSVEKDIEYTYDEYTEHIEQTKAFAKANPQYSLELTYVRPFDNIQIHIYGKDAVCLSKNNSPIINFIIKYPKLVEAFNDMILPVL